MGVLTSQSPSKFTDKNLMFMLCDTEQCGSLLQELYKNFWNLYSVSYKHLVTFNIFKVMLLNI